MSPFDSIFYDAARPGLLGVFLDCMGDANGSIHCEILLHNRVQILVDREQDHLLSAVHPDTRCRQRLSPVQNCKLNPRPVTAPE